MTNAAKVEQGREKPTLIPQEGERALIVGQTGSGKTAFAAWMLRRLPSSPAVIYDTKDEEKFRALVPHRVVETISEMIEAADDETVDYVIVRPTVHLLRDPDALDEFLMAHYERLRKIPAYIDEAYTFHKNGQAGPGLIGLLTRGRSRGITTILSTQRPSFISRFCVTESQRLYLFRLTDKADKKRVGDVVPDFADMPNPPKHGFYFFETGEEAPRLMQPVKLDPALNVGYTDKSLDTPEPGEPADSPRKRVWF
jgi:energy-coupling factor transporter ATP-binding protein EcfA2